MSHPASLAGMGAIARKELSGYFLTPTAYVFIAIFLFAAGALGMHAGRFFDTGRADLAPFFAYHPWLLMIFMPALAMRLWAEEHRSGSVEVLLTLPVTIAAAVLGKFLAAWAVAGAALALTFPMWASVLYLGAPDNGAIAAAYLGSLLLAGGYLAIGAATSAALTNQVVAFVVAVFVSFLLTVAGLPIVTESLLDVAPAQVVEAVAFLSPLERFQAMERGVIAARDVVYFLSLIALGLSVSALFVDARRAG